MKDIFGKALLDYQNGNYSEDLITWTNISEEDVLPLPYLFRTYSEMPEVEQMALQMAKGKILDAGCGTGSHSIYLQKKGLDVMAIDISKGAVEVAKARGVNRVRLKNILEVNGRYDTILMLMNGTGIFQELRQVTKYLKHLKSILNENGQILIDSSDIGYMYGDEVETENLSDNKIEKLNVLNGGRYYGELDYLMMYKGEKEIPMKWLYLDFNTLKMACERVGLNCRMVVDGEHYEYLTKVSLNPSRNGEL